MIGYRKELIARGATLVVTVGLALTTACSKAPPPLDAEKLREFANDYAISWAGEDPAKVAARFAPNGSLTINDAAPLVGREAIAARAKQLMTDYPDVAVKMEELSLFDGKITFYWTMTGRNSGPGGGGRAIKLSGSDEWTLAPDGLIATSRSSYDEADLQRQLTAPIPRSR